MINIALIGCGRVGKRHAKILSDYEVEGARLAAVADILPERAEDFGRLYRVPYFVTDCTNEGLHQMIAIGKPDLITVATPSGCHAEHIRCLLPFDIPLLIEKPLSLRIEDIDRLPKSRWICEVKQNRYNVAVRHLKDAINQGRLGTPRLASVRVLWSRQPIYYDDWHGKWSMAGGVLANQAIHHIDLLWWLLGDVKRVSAIATYDNYTEVETGLVATLEFTSGCIATIEATTLTRPKDLEGSLTILGDKGLVELGGFAVNKIKTWQFKTEKLNDSYIRVANEKPPDVYGFGHIKLYEDIIKQLNQIKECGPDDDVPCLLPPIPLWHSQKVLEIVHAIYEAMETGRVIELNGKYPNSRLGR